MFRITTIPMRHNADRTLSLVGILALCGVLGACAGGKDQSTEDTDQSYRSLEACAAEISDRGLKGFLRLADRKDEGLDILLEEAVRLAESEVYTFWRHGDLAPPMNADPFGRHFVVAVLGKDVVPSRFLSRHAWPDIYLNCAVTLENRHLITGFVEEFIQEERVCEVYDLLREYLPVEELPDMLRLEFLAGTPQIHFSEDVFLIDASLAWAAGHTQLVRALSSVLYRVLAGIEPPWTGPLQGAERLLYTVYQIHQEAIPAHIDGIEQKAFDFRHKRLAGTSPSRQGILASGWGALKTLDETLTGLLATPDPTDEDWSFLQRQFSLQQVFPPAGWYMAHIIEDRLGRARLLEVSRSVPDFFATYQEASALTPRQTDAPRGSEEWLTANAPALTDKNAAWLDGQLRRLFPADR